jgi:hypothetical protein
MTMLHTELDLFTPSRTGYQTPLQIRRGWRNRLPSARKWAFCGGYGVERRF